MFCIWNNGLALKYEYHAWYSFQWRDATRSRRFIFNCWTLFGCCCCCRNKSQALIMWVSLDGTGKMPGKVVKTAECTHLRTLNSVAGWRQNKLPFIENYSDGFFSCFTFSAVARDYFKHSTSIDRTKSLTAQPIHTCSTHKMLCESMIKCRLNQTKRHLFYDFALWK